MNINFYQNKPDHSALIKRSSSIMEIYIIHIYHCVVFGPVTMKSEYQYILEWDQADTIGTTAIHLLYACSIIYIQVY